jgi:hypothetical protein
MPTLRRPLRAALLASGLLLAGALAVIVARIGPRNLWGMVRYDQRREGDLRVGQPAPDVALVALDGSPARLRDRLAGKPLVLVFGSYT